MTDERKYARVYYSVIDDPKFVGIYTDDRHLAAWLRLLLTADAMWPASPPLPRTVRPASLQALVDAKLVDLMPSDCYRIHGLDAERNARAQRASNAAAVRWDSERNADALPRAPGAKPSQEETKPSQAETDAREANPENSHDDRLDGPLAYSEVTTRYPQPGSDLHEWTVRLAEEHGAVPFQKALATEFTINRSGKDLMSRTESRLARQADEALAEFTKNRDTDRAATRAERTARELREVREKEARIAVEPMKPLSELMPNLRIGTRPPGKP